MQSDIQRWHGHLFQNRYKLILYVENRHLNQLVAFIMEFGLQVTSSFLVSL